MGTKFPPGLVNTPPFVIVNGVPIWNQAWLQWLQSLGATGSGPSTGAPVFVGPTVPQGAIDGNNSTFALPSAPNPGFFFVFRNGVKIASSNLTLNGLTFTITDPNEIPQPGDDFEAFYVQA